MTSILYYFMRNIIVNDRNIYKGNSLHDPVILVTFCWYFHVSYFKLHIDGLVQDCINTSANALELPQSCTKPFILVHWVIENNHEYWLSYHEWCDSPMTFISDRVTQVRSIKNFLMSDQKLWFIVTHTQLHFLNAPLCFKPDLAFILSWLSNHIHICSSCYEWQSSPVQQSATHDSFGVPYS